jgi:hypothetical protein
LSLLRLWAALLNEAPTTSKAAEYGTPEMAYEMMQVFTRTNTKPERLLSWLDTKEAF